MAFITKSVRRLQHPTEPGTWVDVLLPLSAGDMRRMAVVGNRVDATFGLLADIIQAWSYDREVSEQALEDLDPDTFLWLQNEVQTASGIRPDDEKKASNGSSPATSAPAEGASPTSSAT